MQLIGPLARRHDVARSGIHFAAHHPMLIGLAVLATVLALLGSALASRASAQEAWSGYLVVKASWNKSIPEASNTANTKAAYYFDGTPASVLADNGPTGMPRVWLQRVRWTGYERQSAFDRCNAINSAASGSGSGIGTVAVGQPGTFPPPAAGYFVNGDPDQPMQGKQTSLSRLPCIPSSNASPYGNDACYGTGIYHSAPQGVDTTTLVGTHRITTPETGNAVGCSSAYTDGDATWYLTRSPVVPTQCANGIDDDGDAVSSQVPSTDYSGGIPQYKDPQCASDADNSEAT